MRILMSLDTACKTDLSEHFVIDSATDLTELAYLASINSYDAIIVPDITAIPYTASAPIFVAVQAYDFDLKVRALNQGAAACVVLPLTHIELDAQLKSIFRQKAELAENVFEYKCILIDLTSKLVYKSQKQLSLRRKEYEILEYLVLNRGRIVSKEELLEHIWERGVYVESNTVEVHVRSLRKKLGVSMVHTFHTRGYLINGS